MEPNPYSIWIKAEEWAEGQWDINDGNTNVIVTFQDDSRWVGSFFTYKNIYTLAEKNRHTGECLHGKYFWGSDMLLVDECSRKRIEEVVEHLIKQGNFERIFDKCEDSIDWGETIKTVKSPSDEYKVLVELLKNDSYEVTVYNWSADEQLWKPVYEEICDNEDAAMQLAFQKLGEYSGEHIVME